MFRFGVTLTKVPTTCTEFAYRAAWVERLGLDVLAMPDRRTSLSPFAAMVAAARHTDRLLLRSYVLDASRWETSLLAREVSSVHLLTDGRVEIGIGAGHPELDGHGIPDFHERVTNLERFVVELQQRLQAMRSCEPVPPILVAAMSKSGLRIAAQRADIVSFGGVRAVPGSNSRAFKMTDSAETDQLVGEVRTWAAGRTYETDILLPAVVLDQDPRVIAERIAANDPYVTVEQALDSPFLLLAESPEHAAEQLILRRNRYGFSSIVTDERNAKALSRVAAQLRGE